MYLQIYIYSKFDNYYVPCLLPMAYTAIGGYGAAIGAAIAGQVFG